MCWSGAPQPPKPNGRWREGPVEVRDPDRLTLFVAGGLRQFQRAIALACGKGPATAGRRLGYAFGASLVHPGSARRELHQPESDRRGDSGFVDSPFDVDFHHFRGVGVRPRARM